MLEWFAVKKIFILSVLEFERLDHL